MNKNSKEIVLYYIYGSTAALITLLSRLIFNIFFSFNLSIIIAHLIGTFSGYLFFKKKVFKKKKGVYFKQEIYKFLFINSIGVIATFFVSIYLYQFTTILFGDYLNLLKFLCHGFGLFISSILCFFLYKKFVF